MTRPDGLSDPGQDGGGPDLRAVDDNEPCRERRAGNVLIPVVLMLTVVATVSLLIGFEGALGSANTARELEADQARFVAEAGYSEMKWRLAQNPSCADYVGVGATAFGAHQYAVNVAPTSGSPVLVTATGSLSSGARSVLTQQIMMLQLPANLLIQPGAAGEDTYLWDGAHKDKNFGSSAKLSLDNQGAERTSLLQFDVSTLPAGQLVSASLELYLEGGNGLTNGVIDVHAMIRSWEEGIDDDAEPGFSPGATYMEYSAWAFGTRLWTNSGGDFEPSATSSLTIPSLAPGFYQWDVSGPVEAWLRGSPNYGVLLRGSAGIVDKLDFTSGDAADASRHPKLILSYACECGVTCGAPLVDDTFILSTLATATLGGLTFSELDLAEYSRGGNTATLYFDGSPTSLDTQIDALHVLENGNFLLSTRDDTIFGGLKFRDGDLVEYDPSADVATLVLDETAVFTGDEDIQAVTLRSTGTLILATEGDAEIGALGWTDLDLVEYDRVTGLATLYLDAATTTLDRPIDGLHILDSGRLVMSVDNDASIGGVDFSQGDLVSYDVGSNTATLFFDSVNFSGGTDDIISVHVGSGSGTTELPGPNAHWKLDETGGTVALDSEGGHDGTLNLPSWTPGAVDGGLEFDGENDYVDLTSDADLDDVFDGGATVMAWIYAREWGESDHGRILDKSSQTAGDRDGWMIAVNGDNPSIELAQGFTGTRGYWRGQAGTFSLDQWVHVAFVYDASSDANDPLIYQDGAALSPLVEGSPSGTIRSDASISLRMGNHAQSTTRSFEGTIDDVRIYDRMLSAVEVAAIASGVGGGAGGKDCSVADDFETDDYTGDTGTLPWTGSWIEVGESDGPDSGDERVVSWADSNRAVRVKDNDNGGEGVEREVDLSGDFTRASFEFKYWRDGLDGASDYVRVDVSHDGGSSWAELGRIEGPGSDDEETPGTRAYDILASLSSKVRIRFLGSSTLGGSDVVYFDDVRILLSGTACP